MAIQGMVVVMLRRTSAKLVITIATPVFVQNGQPIDAISFHRLLCCKRKYILFHSLEVCVQSFEYKVVDSATTMNNRLGCF